MNPRSVMIAVAPNGARKTKKDHLHLPLLPEEIAEEAFACSKAGASLIHLHIRDKDHNHSLSVDIYRETIAAIKKKAGNDIIIQTTTESVGIYTPQQQMQMVRELKPEAISVAIRELIPDASHEEKAGEFFHFLKEHNILTQFILYSPEELRYFSSLMERNILPQSPAVALFVLGKKLGGDVESSYARPEDLERFLEAYNTLKNKEQIHWAICAFGRYEQQCMEYAIAKGGHVRIGFENNHHLKDGNVSPSNAALIEQFVKTGLDKTAYRPATATEARALFVA